MNLHQLWPNVLTAESDSDHDIKITSSYLIPFFQNEYEHDIMQCTMSQIWWAEYDAHYAYRPTHESGVIFSVP